jgi:hypothetical protein
VIGIKKSEKRREEKRREEKRREERRKEENIADIKIIFTHGPIYISI